MRVIFADSYLHLFVFGTTTIETVGFIVRRFGIGTAFAFEGEEIATSAFDLLAMTAHRINIDRLLTANRLVKTFLPARWRTG